MWEERTASQIGKSNVATSKTHERRVANLLTKWAGREFRRRRNEGRGSDTIIRDLTGDVIPIEGLCRFNIECKKEEGFSVDAMLTNIETCKFTKWWHQCNYDAQLCSKQHDRIILPMLFFKPIPNWDWVAIDMDALSFLKPKYGGWAQLDDFWVPHFKFDIYRHCGEITHNVSHTKKDKNKVMVPLQLKPCFICRWKDFADGVDPEPFVVGDVKCAEDAEAGVLPSE